MDSFATYLNDNDYDDTMTLPQHIQNEILSSTPTGNPHLLEQLEHCLSQEISPSYRVVDYLARQPDPCVTEDERSTLCSWSYDIVDACGVDREAACVAITYFDRFLSTPSPRARACLASRSNFQLAFISCLVISLKCRQGMTVEPDFVSDTVCQGTYNREELLRMEMDVLSALEWRLCGPSAHDYAGGLCELLPARCPSGLRGLVTALTRAECERALTEYPQALRRPSEVARDAIEIAARKVSKSGLFLPDDRVEWMKRIERVLRPGVDSTRFVQAAPSLAILCPLPTVISRQFSVVSMDESDASLGLMDGDDPELLFFDLPPSY